MHHINPFTAELPVRIGQSVFWRRVPLILAVTNMYRWRLDMYLARLAERTAVTL